VDGKEAKAQLVIVDPPYGAKHPNAPWDTTAWGYTEFQQIVKVTLQTVALLLFPTQLPRLSSLPAF